MCNLVHLDIKKVARPKIANLIKYLWTSLVCNQQIGCACINTGHLLFLLIFDSGSDSTGNKYGGLHISVEDVSSSHR
jgi:hypothetical protein